MAWQLDNSDVDTSKGFKYSDGRTAPRNWYNVWDDDTKKAEGLKWKEETPPSKTAEQKLQELRWQRNYYLTETDYYALSDVTMSDEMKTYRQQLRDITKTHYHLFYLIYLLLNLYQNHLYLKRLLLYHHLNSKHLLLHVD